MVQSKSKLNLLNLPTSAELPCSDETPVDNEEQNFIPNFLLFLLEFIWADRQDWFWAVDMAVYHNTGVSPDIPVVPDGFLSLGVERLRSSGPRRSYVVWEENDIVPILALEIVSKKYGNEYDSKKKIYANLGVLYYAIYNPEYWRRDKHRPWEIYRLVNGTYRLQTREPFWMPEIGLAIGRATIQTSGLERQVLTWYDRRGIRYLTPEEQLARYRERFGELP